jgi:uncharacterized DUF497 family protein
VTEPYELLDAAGDEVRHLVAGRIGAKPWSRVNTCREHRARIISVRRSRESEIQIFERT